MPCIHNQDGILEFLFKNTYLWKIIQIYTKLSLCFKPESVIHVWIMIITWFLYCWWLPPTSNPHLPCCFFTPGGYFTIFGSAQEINMKKVIQMWLRPHLCTQLHNYHSPTNISCEQWEVIHGLWLTFQEILEYELLSLQLKFCRSIFN